MADEDFRLDKWLWAARFFKTRRAALEAIEGGKVLCNDQRVKPARRVHVGDQYAIRIGPYEHRVIVRALASRRGPASVAASLYEEPVESRTARERLHAEIKANQPLFAHGEGKPTKKDRRALLRLKGKNRL